MSGYYIPPISMSTYLVAKRKEYEAELDQVKDRMMRGVGIELKELYAKELERLQGRIKNCLELLHAHEENKRNQPPPKRPWYKKIFLFR